MLVLLLAAVAEDVEEEGNGRGTARARANSSKDKISGSVSDSVSNGVGWGAEAWPGAMGSVIMMGWGRCGAVIVMVAGAVEVELEMVI